MKVLGFDPASTLAGVAFVRDGELGLVDIWRPTSAKASKNDHLLDWFARVGYVIRAFEPDVVAYEQVQSSRNMNTVRILARWEAAVIIQARKSSCIVESVRAKQARAVVFGEGEGKIEKEDILRRLRVRYPDLKWRASNAGGLDQADAAVVALAAPELLERR